MIFFVRRREVARLLATLDFGRLTALDQGHYEDAYDIGRVQRRLERQAARMWVGPKWLRSRAKRADLARRDRWGLPRG